MKVDTVLPTGTITQAIRYRDLGRAVDWLCDAFGFEKHLVVPDEAGRVIYAQLTYGNGMVLLGPVEASEFDDLLIQPEQISGAETQCCYVVVREIDAHYARAEAAGAPILIPLQGEDYGGRRYTCRDLEGHIWNFGTHDPWQGQGLPRPAPPMVAAKSRSVVALLLTLATLGSTATAGWLYFEGREHVRRLEATQSARAAGVQGTDGVLKQVESERLARERAELAAKSADDHLASERQARQAAERAAKELAEQLAQQRAAIEVGRNAPPPDDDMGRQLTQEREARSAAEHLAQETGQQLATQRRARDEALQAAQAADRAAREAADELAKERMAKLTAEKAAATVTEDIARERSARYAAEAAARNATDQLTAERTARQAASDALEQLRKERAAREAAEAGAKDLGDQLAQERKARVAAERTAQGIRELLAKERLARKAAEQRAANGGAVTE